MLPCLHNVTLFQGRNPSKSRQLRAPKGVPSGRNKRQKIMETCSGDTHLSPPGGSSLDYSRKRTTDPLSSSVTEANHASTAAAAFRPSEALKAALPAGQYDNMRLAILRHQVLAHSFENIPVVIFKLQLSMQKPIYGDTEVDSQLISNCRNYSWDNCMICTTQCSCSAIWSASAVTEQLWTRS